MLAEQIGEAELVAVLVEEAIVLRFAARRQRAALRGDALDVAAQLDLLGEQAFTGVAILGALVWKRRAALGGELGGGGEGWRIGHDVSPW